MSATHRPDATITPRQIARVNALVRFTGQNAIFAARMSFGVDVARLTRAQADTLIDAYELYAEQIRERQQ